MIHFIKIFLELLIVRIQAFYAGITDFERIAKISIFKTYFNT